ncbi:MAG TPA: HAMP domain-containing sensor histidine kinase [Polyangiaceae bacterium]
MRRRLLVFVAMLLAVALVGATLYVDAQREATAALEDFTRDQVALADAAANLASPAALESLEQPSERIVVEMKDGVLVRPDGARLESPTLAAAMRANRTTTVLHHAESGTMGLPARTAVAGIARTRDGRAIAVVATAVRVRDREIRAQERLVLGIVLAALLAFGFGGIALLVQRREHLLERELAAKEAEKLGEGRLARADKLATMGAFATGIAHEIATPLGVIAARAEMARSRATDDKASRAAGAILEQTEKIRGIVQSFLAVARGDPPPRVRIAPRELLRQATRMVEHRYAAATVTLATDVQDGVHLPDVSGEPRLLEQALVNLLLNACDASKPQKRVVASVRVEDGRVCFVIEDEGAGISPDVAARATEPFFTTKSDGKGTGLGLVIANEIAKHHQGRFVIRAREGGGTEARLELPEHDEPKEAARVA